MENPSTPPLDTPWRVVVGAALGAALAVTLIVLAFTWPTKTSEPARTPVSVAGSAETVEAFRAGVEQAQPGVLDVHPVADRAAAVRQIETRETYGAVVLSDSGAPEVLTAPAGSAPVTALLTGIATQLQTQLQAQDPAARVAVTPVVPLRADDANGSGMASLAFPLVLGGMLGGVVIALTVRTPARRLVSVAVLAVAGGLGLTLLTQTWFGFLGGSFWMNATAIGLAVAATAAFIGGCAAVLGPPGIGVGALVTLLLGNPLSGAAVPWQWLPEPWGAVGQHMVPGAATTLVRSLTYFPDASTAAQWWTLLAWLGVGVLLLAFGHRRHRRVVAAA